jgi:type IV pilus assembly protein PilC
MKALLDALNTPLPWPTQVVLWCANVLSSWIFWVVVVILISGATVAWRAAMAEPRFAVRWEAFAVKWIPVIGELLEKSYTARIARVYGVVMNAVSPSRAAQLVIPLAQTTRHRLALESVAEAVAMGVSASAAFEATGAFDPMLPQYLEVGEAGSNVPEACERVAVFLEREVKRGTMALTQAIEPVLTVLVSAVFTVVVLAMYLPYLTVIQTLSNNNGI